MKPVRPDMKQPAMNASVRNVPDCANDNAVEWSGFSTCVEVDEDDDRQRDQDHRRSS